MQDFIWRTEREEREERKRVYMEISSSEEMGKKNTDIIL